MTVVAADDVQKAILCGTPLSLLMKVIVTSISFNNAAREARTGLYKTLAPATQLFSADTPACCLHETVSIINNISTC